MSKVSWLHLSDMHISAKGTFDQKLIHEAFINDLADQLNNQNIMLDFIFFTGDVTLTASNEDYKFALTFFERLCKRIGFDKKNLFIVPGNHDVNRYQVSKVLDDNRRKLETREDIRGIFDNEELLDRYLARFDNYSQFVSELYGISFRMNSENYYFAEKRTVSNLDFGIIGLNSAWASYGGRNDCNNIYVSEVQLKEAMDKVDCTSIKIVLLHHPLAWLYEEDRTDIENLFYQNCNIILHGHLHRPDFQIANSFKGQLVTIPAGAIFTGRRVSNCYNYVTMDLSTNRIRITPRRYYEGPRRFLADIESLGSDGISFFELGIPQSIICKK